MINFKSLFILNIVALLLSVASTAFVYYLSDSIIKIEADFDNEASIEQLNNVNDIEFLREAMKMSYSNNSENILDLADTYKAFAKYLVAFAVLFLANIFLIYIAYKRQISNKALKRDSAKNAAPLS